MYSFGLTADSGGNHIQVFTPVGRFLRKFGKKGSDEGELNFPSSVCIDSNDIVYVTELDNHRVSIFTSQGKFVGTKGTRLGEFNEPRGIAVHRSGRGYKLHGCILAVCITDTIVQIFT